MTYATEILHEAMTHNKMLRRFAGPTTKAKKHRYERRKVRGYIRLGDWNEDDTR
jgi:hypothetical protein